MTYVGGAYGMGVLFKIKPDGTGYTKLLDFAGTKGQNPYGSLFYDGIFLYGMASGGGANFKGVIFKIKPDGTGYSKLLDFSGITNGSSPVGSLISDGIFLYGITAEGGTNNGGVIFKIKSEGTGYSKLLDFSGIANGSVPYNPLISDGIFLYGMTEYGGTNNMGTIFKYQLFATGISNKNTETDFTIFPNPNTGTFTLALETVRQEDVHVKVFNALGELVYTSCEENVNGVYHKEINLRQPEGIYFIQLQIGDNTFTKRVVIRE